MLSPQNDPFRLDTPANHVKGRWFRDQMEACGLFRTDRKIHNRGIHCAIVSLGNAVLPNGAPYINDADCWAFLEEASNTARWLGYVSWEAIFDARNAEPIIRIREEEPLRYRVAVDAGIYLPDADELKPKIQVSGFEVKQPYRLAFYGEKTSLGTVLDPLATSYDADLYLPSGEISNSLLAKMAKLGHQDKREMIVFIFADCDPAGYQMAVSTRRLFLRNTAVASAVGVTVTTAPAANELTVPTRPRTRRGISRPEGPYQDAGQSYEHLCSCLVGQVIGLYQPKGGAT